MICDKTVLAAVSGGPDSMALLDWLNRQGFSIVIAHVNYEKRATAKRDEEIVRAWAADHQQPLWILHPRQKDPGNFQAWARQVRYAFFEAVALECGLSTICLGHHQDDHLETWMLQKERGTLPDHYGLQVHTPWNHGLELMRPLLHVSKADLQRYCDQKGIRYGIDESNLSDAYRRNLLRHRLIEPADAQQRQEWMDWIELDNARLEKSRHHAAILADKALRGDAWMLFDDPLGLGWLALETLLFEHSGRHASKKSVLDLLDKLKGGTLQRFGGLRLQILPFTVNFASAPAGSSQLEQTEHENRKEDSRDDHQEKKQAWNRSRLVLREDTIVPFYVDSLEQLSRMADERFAFGSFCMARSGKTIESFAPSATEFPLIIRPARAGDRLKTRYGTKKISRLLIDRHIPAIFRDRFPVIEGRNGILFASLAGCDPNHYDPVENRRFYMVESTV